MQYTMDDFIDQVNVPGMEEFFALLATPDPIFNIMYPELRKSILEEMEAPDFLALLNDAKTSLEYEEFRDSIPELLEDFKKIKGISQQKIEFLTLLFGMFVDDYDARVYIELSKDATLPAYAHPTDAGLDIYAAEDILISSGAMGIIIKTGLKVAIPEGWQLSIRPRSGMSTKTGIRIANTPATIDSEFRSEVGVILDNFGEDYTIKKGDRIAQFVLEKVYTLKWEPIENITEIKGNRGGGFGSTGT